MIGTRAAAILGAAIIVAVGLYLYFSPFQQCVRSITGGTKEGTPETWCLALMTQR